MALACTVDKYFHIAGVEEPYVAYQLKVQDGDEICLVWRRFTQFSELHAQLSRDFDNVPSAPKKRMFGKMFNSGTPKFLEGRQVELNDWMQTILQIPGIGKTQQIEHFLTFEKNVQPNRMIPHTG